VPSPRSRWIAAAEAASLLGFAALFARLVHRHGALAGEEPLAFASGAFAGALLADLASGAFHWLCDRFGSETTPVVGPYLISAFREHHRDPASIARHGLCERSGGNAFATLPVLLAADGGSGALGAGDAAAFAVGGALAFAAYVALTNEIHLQAHRPSPVRLVSWLQRLRLVLSPEQHARHHRGDHDRAFCIATGWSNALLDRFAIPARLERRLRRRGA
jgi:ubiquitin-conjugating enzyme E2 variant